MPNTGYNGHGKTVTQRLLERVRIVPSGCWEWQGAQAGAGYGTIGLYGPTRRQTYTHRVAYELFVGPIGDGLHIDHLCRNHICCNPEHLEPVTPRENGLRGIGTFVSQVKRTHCPRGHEYTPANTYVSKKNCRTCRQCWREKARTKQGWKGLPLPGERTHCPQGHPYDAQNTRVYNGRRHCRACGRAAHQRWKAKQVAA